MQIRQITEQRELALLSPYAMRAQQSRGRLWPEEECAIRTCWQRDRDRILHSKAFRRLKHKTQVFIQPEGDHYRTRLTHTLEVSQVARTIARALALNEDLTEAISLGHDLGHTPFGHAGEQTLDRLLPGGFRHNEQSLRVVDKLEGDGGLNLTVETRNGIYCHTGDKQPTTLEGIVVRLADRIAYINHDIDDALRAGVLKKDDLPQFALQVLGQSHAERIHNMVLDVVEQSRGRGVITVSEHVQEATDELRDFLFDRVYIGSEAKRDEGKAERMVATLFAHYRRFPEQMPSLYQAVWRQEGLEIAVADYIAGMTDRFIIHQFEQMFIPQGWTL
mgnify:FL=1